MKLLLKDHVIALLARLDRDMPTGQKVGPDDAFMSVLSRYDTQGALTGESRDTDPQLQTLTAAVGVPYYIRK